MLPSDAFLRNMPRSIEMQNRYELQSILSACDIIDFAYLELCNWLGYLKDIILHSKIENKNINPLMMYCWVLIDQIHTLRQMLQLIDNRGDITQKLIKETEIVTILRNKMDHIASNTRNLSKRKGAVLPLHGAVMFTTPTDAEKTARIYVVPFGPLHELQQVSPVVDTHQRFPNGNIDNIIFAAFDLQINLTDLHQSCKQWLIANDKFMKDNFIAIVKDHCRENSDINLEEVLKDSVSGNVFMSFEIRY